MSEYKTKYAFRNMDYSQWHRDKAGYNLCTDIDMVLHTEYDVSNKEPVALLEIKAESEKPISDSNKQCLIRLADRAELPFFYVRYRFFSNGKEFQIIPMNNIALAYMAKPMIMDEDLYVRFLERLREKSPCPHTTDTKAIKLMEKINHD